MGHRILNEVHCLLHLPSYSSRLFLFLPSSLQVLELFYWVLPEFNDEFVKAHYSEQFASAEEMRKGLLATTAMERCVLHGAHGGSVCCMGRMEGVCAAWGARRERVHGSRGG